jgi:hypothetical protein
MTMMHYGSKDYDVAASDAATRARAKFEGMLDKGRARVGEMMGKLQDEQPTDLVIPRPKMAFDMEEIQTGPEDDPRYYHRPVVRVVNGDVHDYGLHTNAVGQVAQRLGIPVKYIRSLEDTGDPWAMDLLAHNLNKLNQHADQDDKFLLRAVNGEVRGFLSDRYRRMDSGPVLEAFADAAMRFDAVPVDSYASDTRWYLKMMLPHVFEPVPNEVMTFGVTLQNSDYGDGALSLKVFSMRLWCTNYCIRDETLRKVHLGRRLSEDVAFSDKTHELDTAAISSMVNDIVGTSLAPKRVRREMKVIELANEEGINAGTHLDALTRKSLLTKAEAKETADIFNQADVETLPPGNSMWRLTNALSALAGVRRKEGEEKRGVELEEVAGKLMSKFEKTINIDDED